MKPELLKVSNQPAQSFSVRRDLIPYVNNKWHYHPEVELIHFRKGFGTQFIGDNIKTFQSGDIVLVGAHLAHYWRYDDSYFEEGSTASADADVVHFKENFWGDHFLNLPENKSIKTVLEQGRSGLQINGEAKIKIAEILDKLLIADGYKRVTLLLDALSLIANSPETQTLCSIGYLQIHEESESERINAIYEHTLTHFKRRIPLEEIAEIAAITPNSFCRYFKSKTRKTYSQFIAEIKVGHACKLLIENKLNMKQLCYESGFNNLSNFYKYFKQTTGISPLNYQKTYISKNRLSKYL